MVYLITGAFIALDFVTGLVKSFKNHDYKSVKMRAGLWHKCGNIICIIFGMLVDYAQTFVDIGVTVPVAGAICTYIILMESGSIIENIGEINPDIIPAKLKQYFNTLGGNDK